MTLRLRRSELSTPASSPKMIEKAMATAADMVFLDLEDAVAPAQKEAARKNAVDALRNLDWGKKVRAVRVNGADTHWAHDDVIEVVEGASSGYPGGVGEIRKAGQLLERLALQRPEEMGLIDAGEAVLDVARAAREVERHRDRGRPADPRWGVVALLTEPLEQHVAAE